MRVLIWQWGRRGAGPRVAAELARSFAEVPGTETLLSLSTGAELLRSAHPPVCDLAFRTYGSVPGYVRRVLQTPLLVPRLVGWMRQQRVDVALCAMPAPLDLVMAEALARAGLPFAVVVHDADLHPGDAFPLQMPLQRRLLRQADGVFALSSHVADGLRRQGVQAPLFRATLPPFGFGPTPPPPRSHGGPLRLLSFGRLLPYKGLDLLADSLRLLGPRRDMEVRVVGSGPETRVLQDLRAMPGVTVENRWVPEDEVGPLLAWSDALVLSHREASQSGVAAAAVAARRWVVATKVGGLVEQLRDEPMAVPCEPDGASIAAGLQRVLAGEVANGSAASGWPAVAAQMVQDVRLLLAGREAASVAQNVLA